LTDGILKAQQQLCTTCEGLKLSVDQFIIRSSQSPNNQHSLSDFPLKSSTTKYPLGTLEDIRRRGNLGCPLCNLVRESIKDPKRDNEHRADYPANLPDAVCHANWEVDGRKVVISKKPSTGPEKEYNPVRGLTRRIHLTWEDKRLKDSYLVYLPPQKYSKTTSDAHRVWGKESLFLGRTIEKYGDNQALVKSWLDLCESKHGGPCIDRNDESAAKFLEMIRHSYFGVIDVLNMQLVGLPFDTRMRRTEVVNEPSNSESSHSDSSSSSGLYSDYKPRTRVRTRYRQDALSIDPAKYVALSYVWGQTPSYTTTTANVMLHRTHGGIEKVLYLLPRVVQDAIDLVRRLGLQYLWIDALCIVQDSPRSWKLNAYNMDLIYGNATLTICAADGEDASIGLRAMHSSGEYSSYHVIRNCNPPKRPPLNLMVTRPPEMYIRASKWNTRAWTFQERLLSRRCLIFTEGRVYFQCRSTGMSEDIFADREGAGWSLDLVDAPMQIFRQLSQKAIWVYMKSVELYSSRQLTKPKDILAAFSGMSNLMEQGMRSPFIFGLPSSHLDLALLWEPTQAAERRKAKNDKEKQEYGGMEFPSWSWSGWMGATTSYGEGMVGGCLDNVSRWMEKHTWIKWYVRDGHGDLRPLWDDKKSQVDRSKEKRWRGYKSGRSYRSEESPLSGRERVRYRRRDRSYDQGLEGDIEEFEDLRPYQPSVRVVDADPRPIRRSVVMEKDTKSRERAEYSGGRRYGLAPEDISTRERERKAGLSTGYTPTHNSDFYEMYFENSESSREFQITLKDYPYRVVVAPYHPTPDSFEFPLIPILQFWTWHTFLNVRRPSGGSDASVPKLTDGLLRCHIADDIGDWCGSIVLDEGWASKTTSAKQEFIAISRAKNFTTEECEAWTYYIPKEREQSEWDLYYVLLVERVDEKWERVGLGKVFKEAFRRNAQWREIMLG
jgi:hypothetical protein